MRPDRSGPGHSRSKGVRAAAFTVSLMCVLAVIHCCFTELTSQEPTFQGLSLSEWLVMHENARKCGDLNAMAMSEKAVRYMGTNALPVLLKWVIDKPSKARDYLPLWIQEWSEACSTNRMIYGERNDLACRAFAILGTQAVAGVPELSSMLESQDAGIRFRAFRCLNSVLEGNVPLRSLRMLTNDSWRGISSPAAAAVWRQHSRQQLWTNLQVELEHGVEKGK